MSRCHDSFTRRVNEYTLEDNQIIVNSIVEILQVFGFVRIGI
jgi:hypothetical protein